MESLHDELKRRTESGPYRSMSGVVAMAATRDGTIFAVTGGQTKIGSGAVEVATSTVMWLASCTKLMTTVAALQCVDSGFLALDEPISRFLPEWTEPEILLGFDYITGQPRLKASTSPITLHMLLCHTAGLALKETNHDLQRWYAARRKQCQSNKTISDDLLIQMTQAFADDDDRPPLVYEPGHGWSYGPALDIVARLIERVTGFPRLGDYMQRCIWQRLNMNSTTFRPLERQELVIWPLTVQAPGVGLTSDVPLTFPSRNPERDSGGSGAFASADDFVKLLTSLLTNDGKLLRPETVDMMFQPQLESNVHLMAQISAPELAPYLIPGMPTDGDWNWGFGGIITSDGISRRAGKHCMFWSGITNSQWWIDREVGTCGLLFTQLLPPGNDETATLFRDFQEAVYSVSQKCAC